MDRDTLIKAAREAGVVTHNGPDSHSLPIIEKFAALLEADVLLRAATNTAPKLPALPKETYFGQNHGGDITGYTAKQMRAYARAALAQQPAGGAPAERVLRAGAALACAAHNLAKTGECHLQADAAALFGKLADEWSAALAAAPAAAQPRDADAWGLTLRLIESALIDKRPYVIHTLRKLIQHYGPDNERGQQLKALWEGIGAAAPAGEQQP